MTLYVILSLHRTQKVQESAEEELISQGQKYL